MRLASTWLAAAAMTAALFGSATARADADPAIGYVHAGYAIPWHVATSASKPQLSGGEWTTSKEVGARTGPQAYTLDATSFGVGIGYDGFNVQLDVQNFGNNSSGTLTFGYRLNIQFGNIELWTRLAAGPLVSIDYAGKDVSRNVAGGIATVAEGGVDYFFWKETMAFGVHGLASPHYSFPATFAADFDINLGVRLIL